MVSTDSLFESPANPLLLLGLVASSLFIIGVALSLVQRFKRSKLAAAALPAAFVAIALIVASVVVGFGNTQENRAQWLQDEYGIIADSGQVKDLRFPQQRPEADEASFGITQVGIGKRIVSVQLYWENDKFVLLGTDGEPLSPLPRAE